MNATAKRSGVDLRIVLIAAIVLLLAFGGAAAWAYTTNTNLETNAADARPRRAPTSTDQEVAGRHRRAS